MLRIVLLVIAILSLVACSPQPQREKWVFHYDKLWRTRSTEAKIKTRQSVESWHVAYLKAVPGIISASSGMLNPYEISVQRADTFTWEEIQPLAIAALNEARESRVTPLGEGKSHITLKFGEALSDGGSIIVCTPSGEALIDTRKALTVEDLKNK